MINGQLIAAVLRLGKYEKYPLLVLDDKAA